MDTVSRQRVDAGDCMLKRKGKRRFAICRAELAVPSAPARIRKELWFRAAAQVDGAGPAHDRKVSGSFIWPSPYLLPLLLPFFLLNHLLSYSLITLSCPLTLTRPFKVLMASL